MTDKHFPKKNCVQNPDFHSSEKKKHISTIISLGLLKIVVLVFLTATLIAFILLTIDTRNSYLKSMESFTELDIENFNNRVDVIRAANLENAVAVISEVLDWQEDMRKDEKLDLLMDQLISKEYMTELDFVDSHGKIVYSSEEDLDGYDLSENVRYAALLTLFDQPEGVVAVLGDASFSVNPIQYYTAMKIEGEDLLLLMGTTREDEEHILKKSSDSFLSEDLSLFSIGETGYVLRADMDMIVRTSNKPEYIGMNLQDMGFPIEKDKEYRQFSILPIEGEMVFYYMDNSPGLYIVYVFPLREAMREPLQILYFLLIFLIVVCLVIYWHVAYLIRIRVFNNISKVNQSLSGIVQGKLDQKVDVRDSLEFDFLSEGINSTVDRLIELIDEAGKRIDKELAFAKIVQLSSLPSVSSISSRNEIALDAYMEPAKEVGGDFYDFFLIGENRLGLVIADVSGKGISAAMFMMKSEALIRDRALQGGTPGEILRDVNAALLRGSQTNYFVTVWLGILDLKTGEGTAVNAGHTDPIVRRGSGVFRLERYTHELVVGVIDGINYMSHDFRLNPGDCLFVYTDGVIEAINSDKEQFGKKRTLDVLNRKADASPRELIRNLRSSISDFAGNMEQFDDMTMLCIEYIGQKGS